MLDKTTIIPRSSPAATEIIKNYSKIPKKASPQRPRRTQPKCETPIDTDFLDTD